MNKEVICGIYKITSPLGKIYIGESIDIQSRWKSYKGLGCKRQPKLYESLYEQGVINHTFEIIEECLFEDLLCRERYWQDFYDVLNGGLNGGLNGKLTECGDKKQVPSRETIDKANKTKLEKGIGKGDKNPMYGKTHSDDYKKEMSERISKLFEENPSIIQTIKEKLSGGTYHTPNGDFISQRDAAKANSISRNTLINWCVKKSDKVVGYDRQTPKQFRGEKTWREHGFYFIPKK